MPYHTEEIPVSDLLLDQANPRLEAADFQLEAIQALVRDQGAKLVTLASDIVANGLSPAELPIVVKEGEREYTVLEGNRRVVVLKLLNNPDLVEGLLPPAQDRALRRLSAEHSSTIPKKVRCTVVDKRSEADHWIELRHTGENEGAGIVRWGGIETQRFAARRGGRSTQLQALDWVRDNAGLSQEALASLNKVKITTLWRILGDKDVREALGYRVVNNEFVADSSSATTTLGLKKIVEDLAREEVNVQDVYTKPQRREYLSKIMASVATDSPKVDAAPVGTAHEPTVATGAPSPKRKGKITKPSLDRTYVFPERFNLRIEDTRLGNIFAELKTIEVDHYRNTVGVMLRVFFELAADERMIALGIDPLPQGKDTLSNKIKALANKLRDENKISQSQQEAILSVSSRTSDLFSYRTLQLFVHNLNVTPSAKDLKAIWDNLQWFFELLYD
jgi:hypothetical protein